MEKSAAMALKVAMVKKVGLVVPPVAKVRMGVTRRMGHLVRI